LAGLVGRLLRGGLAPHCCLLGLSLRVGRGGGGALLSMGGAGTGGLKALLRGSLKRGVTQFVTSLLCGGVGMLFRVFSGYLGVGLSLLGCSLALNRGLLGRSLTLLRGDRCLLLGRLNVRVLLPAASSRSQGSVRARCRLRSRTTGGGTASGSAGPSRSRFRSRSGGRGGDGRHFRHGTGTDVRTPYSISHIHSVGQVNGAK
jgi:hypothetical protein